MPQSATIKSLPGAFRMMKAMQADGIESGEDYRQGARPVSPATVSAVAVRRGLTGERLEMLCVDGGSGLLAALPTAFPDIPVQRCWAHKIRNVLTNVRKPDQAAIKAGLHRIMNAPILPAAWSAARRFAERWGEPLSQGGGMSARRSR